MTLTEKNTKVKGNDSKRVSRRCVMSNKSHRSWRDSNPDLRRQVQMPAPAIEVIEQELWSLVSPESFKPLRLSEGKKGKKLRERILTLPVMMAIVLSLVYRRIPGLSELVRVLQSEGLLWVGVVPVSKQALSKRLSSLPAQLFASVFEQVMQRIRAKNLLTPVTAEWAGISENFAAVWIADGSTLEELRHHLKVLRDKGTVLAGKMMMLVEAFNHRPVATWYTEDAAANDKTFCQLLLERLPEGGLLIFDLGFFKFPWFDDFLERISLEMVFRSLYHFSQALLRGETVDLVPYLVEHQQLFGLVKAVRNRHRDNYLRSQLIWAVDSLS